MRKRRAGKVKVEKVQPLVLRARWDDYADRIHEAIGLDIRFITGALTGEDEEVLRHRETQMVPVMGDEHDMLTVVGTYTTLPMMETRK